MGNYNPKTAYQFKWQDAKKTQKFIQGQVVLYDIELSSNDEISVDETPEAKELVKTMKYCYDNQIPLIIYEYSSDQIFISFFLENENVIRLTNFAGINALFVELNYDSQGTLYINCTHEALLSEDNVKTFFGNQSIIGTGNIDLYNHFLTLTSANTTYYINYQSSNNLECDSLTDLTTMTKAVSGTKIGLGSTYMIYSSGVWKLANNELITTVSDVVTTI